MTEAKRWEIKPPPLFWTGGTLGGGGGRTADWRPFEALLLLDASLKLAVFTFPLSLDEEDLSDAVLGAEFLIVSVGFCVDRLLLAPLLGTPEANFSVSFSEVPFLISLAFRSSVAVGRLRFERGGVFFIFHQNRNC